MGVVVCTETGYFSLLQGFNYKTQPTLLQLHSSASFVLAFVFLRFAFLFSCWYVYRCLGVEYLRVCSQLYLITTYDVSRELLARNSHLCPNCIIPLCGYLRTASLSLSHTVHKVCPINSPGGYQPPSPHVASSN